MTPLYDALAARAARDQARFHMPGHKGYPIGALWGEITAVDFTELSDTGDLYRGNDGPIRAAERLYAEAYGAGDCLFLTGGSTQGVLAMLAAFARPGDTVLVDRNAHASVHHALALLDLHPVWLFSQIIEPFGVSGGLPARTLEMALVAHPEAVCALVTTPTYHGVQSDLVALSATARRHGVPLLADAAHGAHLPYVDGQAGPTAQGAAAACLSAHKTLPALGQAAFLLTADPRDTGRLRDGARLFGTASPSYVLMASLDLARDYMARQGRAQLAEVVQWADRWRDQPGGPFLTGAVDPARLCLFTGRGAGDAAWLEQACGVVCEMADARNVVFLLSALDSARDLDRLSAALHTLWRDRPPPAVAPTLRPPDWPPPFAALSPRQAFFARHVICPLAASVGRPAARAIAPYPPGVPLVAPGELIDKNHTELLYQMGYDGNTPVCVVDEPDLKKGPRL
ncbi:MAG: DegT/DnrJ/EryC1/StrS family aminotransferase [Oscillospiraceae bacterium]|jgi:arginine/lysine/ornithine decarboxylase|nr:DegT/DnrJ/EryC1/StrS family aminotransferase [Oscillospiraceae bacterium]